MVEDFYSVLKNVLHELDNRLTYLITGSNEVIQKLEKKIKMLEETIDRILAESKNKDKQIEELQKVKKSWLLF